ncbi:fasciclin-like arabinogalactan protein 11 [Abrus precatorius]|uniref:Fasciclin-like arabinogalactan protein 11 n=1 Tax=Abrus precatorius TaxID=3816 RepID=A0A8B8KAV0_ABRPR|nr:fasciclin-like arabinogalactan protein 11 [Abrus precatorius]
MTLKKIIFSASLLLLLLTLFSTTSAQKLLSPVQPPLQSPPTPTQPPQAPPPAAAPGMSTVPLVPVSPDGAPTPSIPKPPTIDILQILKKAKRFSTLMRLLKTTQLMNQLNSQLATSNSGGLTMFAPEDSAFSKLKAGFLNSLNDRQKVELLQFHTLSSFISVSNFDTLTNPVQTQAGDDPKRLQLNVTTYGGTQVSMTTGAVYATVTGTVYADNKLAIYQVDKVLLPLDFVLPKAKAPSPSPAKGVSPKSDKTKSSEDESKNDNGDDGVVPVDANSAGSMMGFNKVEIVMWVPLLWVLGATI